MRMQNVATIVALLLISAPVAGAEVWRSTFDDEASSGVVDLFDNNPNKEMIGPLSNGRLQIHTQDSDLYGTTPDKAGRPLGSTLTGNDSMSGVYKFNWSTYNTDETLMWEAIGFLGDDTTSGAPSSPARQVLGAIVLHWRLPNGEYYVEVDVAVGSVGWTNFGYLAGSPAFLGDENNGFDITANDYEFRILYDGTDRLLDLELLDDAGNLITGHSVDLDTDVPGLQQGSFGRDIDDEMAAFELTHLGWSEYNGYGGDRSTIWQVDELAYYDEKLPPTSLEGDYNGNGVVDAADYVVWRSGGSPDSTTAGYDVWKGNFGAISGADSAALSTSVRSVPEPASKAMLILGLAGICPFARRKSLKM